MDDDDYDDDDDDAVRPTEFNVIHVTQYNYRVFICMFSLTKLVAEKVMYK